MPPSHAPNHAPNRASDPHHHPDDTEAALALLAAAQRRPTGRWPRWVYPAYVAGLVVAVYGVPYLRWLRQPGFALPADVAAAVLTVLPHLVVILACALTVTAARWSRWTGPARITPADVDWLLAAPVSRDVILGRAIRRALAMAGGVGALVGGVLGLVAELLLDHRAAGGALGSVLSGALAAELGAVIGAGFLCTLTGASAAVQGLRRRRGWIRLASGLARVGALAVGTNGFHRLRSGVDAGFDAGFDAGTGAQGGGPGRWTWAAAWLLAASGVGGYVVGVRYGVRVGLEQLRASAEVRARVGSALLSADPRLAVVAAQPSRPGWSLRLPAPPHRVGVALWRSALLWARSPGRLVAVSAWGTVAAAALAVSEHQPPDVRLLLVGTAAIALFFSAALAAEPIRVECDDPRRSDPLPYPFPGWLGRLAGAAILPVGASAGAGLIVAGLLDHLPPRAPVLLLLVPAMVAASMASACRGPTPVEMLAGVMTPLGSTGPLQAVLWYLRGPLVALVVATPVTLWVVDVGTIGGLLGSYARIPIGAVLYWIGFTTIATGVWARVRARRLHRP